MTRSPSPAHGLPGRRTGFAAVAVVAAALSTTAAPAMAQSAPSIVVAEGYPDASFAYSADGVAYSDSVPELFATSANLVPGEGVEEKLWVRNDNAMAVNVSVAAMAPTGTGEAAHAGLPPSPVVTLEPGAAAPLNVRMWLPESADNSSQASALPIRLQVNAREAAPAGSGELVDTGATGGIWPLSVAVLLGGAGAYLGSRKRSRKL